MSSVHRDGRYLRLDNVRAYEDENGQLHLTCSDEDLSGPGLNITLKPGNGNYDRLHELMQRSGVLHSQRNLPAFPASPVKWGLPIGDLLAQELAGTSSLKGLNVSVGTRPDGTSMVLNLARHLLVGGAPGSGALAMTFNAVLQLVARYPSSALQVSAFCSLGRLFPYAVPPQVRVQNSEHAERHWLPLLEELRRLKKLMDDRMYQMVRIGAKSFDSSIHGSYQVLLLTEVGDLFDAEAQYGKISYEDSVEIQRLLVELACRGRSAGIVMVLAHTSGIRLPSALTGSCQVLGMNVPTRLDSKRILGMQGLEHLQVGQAYAMAPQDGPAPLLAHAPMRMADERFKEDTFVQKLIRRERTV